MASERILVIDDEHSLRSAIVAVLEADQYQSIFACDTQQAIEHLQNNPPYDLVLFDIVARGPGGIDLLDWIRHAYQHTQVIVITAVNDAGVAMSALRKGAYDYLLKPLDPEKLLSTARQALEHHRLAQQNSSYQSTLEQLVADRTEMLHQAMADLERSYDITLEALGDALDLKDAETEGHSKRVTAYTVALARAMGLSPAEIRVVARGAFLHDIGKMAIPDAILLKPGRLNPDEQTLMREHCMRGYQILSKIPFLREAAEIVYTHQEHFDGSGYPRGLKGEDIPLGARIFSVADTLDAITSNRPYRKADSFEAARKEIRRCSGTQFDPKVVDVYLSMPDRLWIDLRAEISHHARFAPLSL